jgi:hypothetical protein
MQPSNYLVAYLQGMFAEFLAIHINKDPNFVAPTQRAFFPVSNRYMHTDIIRMLSGGQRTLDNTFQIMQSVGYPNNHPPYYTKYSNSVVAAIDKATTNHSCCTLTHFYWPDQTHLINIPRLKNVFFFVEPENVPFVFIMAVIKVWKHGPGKQIAREIFQRVTPYGSVDLINRISAIEDFRPKIIDEYLFNTGFRDDEIGLFLKECYSYYYQRAIIGSSGSYKLDNWIYLDPYKLVTKPKAHMDEWKEKLNLSRDLDGLGLLMYNQKNKQLIYNELGMSYEQLMQEDWMGILQRYLEKHSFFFNYEDKVLR